MKNKKAKSTVNQTRTEKPSENDYYLCNRTTFTLPVDWVEKATQSINRVLEKDLCRFNEKVAREQKIMW